LHTYPPSSSSFPPRRSSDLRGNQDELRIWAGFLSKYIRGHGLRSAQYLHFWGSEGRLRGIRSHVQYGQPIRGRVCAFRHSHHRRSEEHTSELQSRENLVCRL